MEGIYAVYPGTFCPPHRGHFNIVEKLVEIFGKVHIVCSRNPDKEGKEIFSPQECKELWNLYNLPAGAEVVTFEEFIRKGIDFGQIVMVRGARDDRDFEYEKRIMMKNFKEFGIDKFFVIVSDERFREISSTLARELAKEEKMEELCDIATPAIAERLIEKMRN